MAKTCTLPGCGSAFSPAALLASLLVLTLSATQACSPPVGGYQGETPIEQSIKYSTAVVLGTPVQTMVDERFPSASQVKFEVYCVFKGTDIPEYVRIKEVGEIPGLCFASNLTEGVRYVVFLKLEPGDTAYRQDYPAIVAERAVIQEMPDYCEVIPSYPKGVDSTNAKVTCPPPRSDPDECIEAPTDAPPELESPPPPLPPGHGKPGAKSPAAGPGNPKPGNTEASYEPVVEGDSDGKSDDGGKDAANILAWNWTLALAVLSSLLCL